MIKTFRTTFLMLAALLYAAPAMATATEVPFVLPGDVPALSPAVQADVIAGMPHWLQVVLVVLGAVVPVFSIVAAFINRYVRALQAQGQRVSPLLLALGGFVNVGAINPDKAHQQLTSIGKEGEQ